MGSGGWPHGTLLEQCCQPLRNESLSPDSNQEHFCGFEFLSLGVALHLSVISTGGIGVSWVFPSVPFFNKNSAHEIRQNDRNDLFVFECIFLLLFSIMVS